MDRKMFDITDFRNHNNLDDRIPQICFDTNACNPPKPRSNDGVLTMAFVNMQPLDYVYDDDQAYINGSLFPNINKPFYYGGLNK